MKPSVWWFYASSCYDCKGFATKLLKVSFECHLSHYFWSLNKWEAHMTTVVIPTPFTWFGCKYPQIKLTVWQLTQSCRFIWNHCGGCIEPKSFRLCRCPQYYGHDCMYTGGCNSTRILTETFRTDLSVWYTCAEQILQFFQEIQTINAVLTLFDVARHFVNLSVDYYS